MKNHKILLAISIALALTACSSSESRKSASGSFDYLEKDLKPEIKIPEELDQPPRDSRYDIPNMSNENASSAPLGEELSVASPRLVLPLVSGSHVEEGSKEAKVLFDQVKDNEALDKTIWDTVLAYLDLNQIGVEKFDKENNVLITDWVVDKKEVDGDWYDLSDDYIEHAKKFKLTLELAPHGRTASLTTEILDYLDENGQSQLAKMNPIERRTDEVNFLNYIIAEYDFGIRLERSQRIALIREGFSAQVGTNNAQEPAFIIDAEYANAWPRLQLVLRKMNFDVVDLDQSSGIMFVKYNGSDDSWITGLFSGDELELDEGDYRLLVEASGDNTIVSFKDAENNAFSQEQTDKISEVFIEYMSSNDLDI